MIIVLKPDAGRFEEENLVAKIRDWGLKPHVSRGEERTIIGVIGDEALLRAKPLEALPGVERVMPVMKPYKLASADFRAERTRVRIPGVNPERAAVELGGRAVAVIAGPCSIENRELIFEVARAVRAAGASLLRGGAFKPRTSPYAFQGLGVKGLRLLAEVRAAEGMPVITEVMDTRDVEMVAEFADVLQVGARNMQNFTLLKSLGRCRRPVMIKRGPSCSIQELLMSAEYVMSEGNPEVILCERGIRTFETLARNTLDLSAVPILRRESHLPVVVDPSHGTGYAELVPAMALAAVAAGADGLMIEVHAKPEEALCDGPQALRPEAFSTLMRSLSRVAEAVDRCVGGTELQEGPGV